ELGKDIIKQFDPAKFDQLTSEGIGGFDFDTAPLLPDQIFESIGVEEFGDLDLQAIAGLDIKQLDAIASDVYQGFDIDQWPLPGDCDCDIVDNLSAAEFNEVAEEAIEGINSLDSIYMGTDLKKALAYSEVVKQIDAEDIADIAPEKFANMMPETVSLLATDAIAGFTEEQVAVMDGDFFSSMDEEQVAAINPDVISEIDVEVIAEMDATAADVITDEQLAGFNEEQVLALGDPFLGELDEVQLAILQDIAGDSFI
ncbi:MAG: hypothetical protein AB8A40_09675, partial [Prochlorococcus sp.]